jgi:lipopolysaccharide biosynthesis protein
MTRRLFVFAGYDRDGIIDAHVVNYVSGLSAMGDVIFVTDNDAGASELDKIRTHALYAAAARHGEYDFGSYKRGFIRAADARILDNYDYVYFVNDSVFGPFFPLGGILERLESGRPDVSGMFRSAKDGKRFVQSWFWGVEKRVFMSDWFGGFIRGIAPQDSKQKVVAEYELGMNRLFEAHGCRVAAHIAHDKKHLTRHPLYFFRKGMPFLKKNAATRPHAHISEVRKILRRLPRAHSEMILGYLARTAGKRHVDEYIISPFGWARYVLNKFLGRLKS